MIDLLLKSTICFFFFTYRRFHVWLIGQASFFDTSTSLTPCTEMTESTMHGIELQVCKTKKRVKALMRTVELQNKLLLMMAGKMGLSVEAEDLDAKDWAYDTAQLEPATLGDSKHADEKDDSEYEVAKL